jgi:tripartite-type tricarboxylate transporter receptor subunit TctC
MLARTRSPLLPDLATASEQGLADFEAVSWYGLLLPKDAPASIVRKLHEAAAATLDTPSVHDRLRSLGVEIVSPERRSPDYLAGFIKGEFAKWAPPIKASGISVN